MLVNLLDVSMFVRMFVCCNIHNSIFPVACVLIFLARIRVYLGRKSQRWSSLSILLTEIGDFTLQFSVIIYFIIQSTADVL